MMQLYKQSQNPILKSFEPKPARLWKKIYHHLHNDDPINTKCRRKTINKCRNNTNYQRSSAINADILEVTQ